MDRKGFTLVEIIIILIIIMLLSVIALPYLTTPEKAGAATAKEILRKLSVSAENYAASHSGAYPASIAEFTEYMPLAGSYCANATGVTTAVGEYSYACILTVGGYTFTASPVTEELNKGAAYTVVTGGALRQE